MVSLVDFNPFAPEVVADPYPWYGELVRRAPVHWIASRELYMVTGYDAVAAVVRDPAIHSSALGYAALADGAMGLQGAPIRNVLDMDTSSLRMLISTDPPDHTRIRKLLSRVFTPRAITELGPRLGQVCTELVDAAIARAADGVGDLVEDLAITFPVTVIAELLDIPVARRDDFRRWSTALAGALSGDIDLDEAAVAAGELLAFMAEVVEARRATPGTDLISRLVIGTGPDDPDPLTFDEITMIAILLLAAGNETTTNLISNLAAALDQHPDQAARLSADPSLLPFAIEEALRWDSPVQATLRGTTQPTTLAGVDLPAGSLVLICFAAANRDPAHFEEPDRFSIDRRTTDHFAFGHGIHFCLGASLARMETKLLYEALAQSRVSLDRCGEPIRTSGFMLRGFTKYPLRYQHALDA